jgi:homoserine O-acetyltransferase
MHRLLSPLLSGAVIVLASTAPAAATSDAPQVASLGDLKLENGQVLRDCKVAYRTFGELKPDKSNVVLFPTWFSGSSADLTPLIGPGKLIDSSRYYVITVDALANGVSSSPTNSSAQPRMQFPRISIRDMVMSQHELLTRALQIQHVKAVMGISMGGMQTFQWVLSFPDFMDKAIPIVGSPQLAPYDLLLWQANLDAIQKDPEWKNGDYREEPVLPAVQELADLELTTPEQYNQSTTRKQFFESIGKRKAPVFGAADRVIQLQAMMGHDVTTPFAGSMDKAAAAAKAKLLVVVNTHDHMVTPGPATQFAKLAHAQLLELKGDCGHKAPTCEEAKVGATIARFLDAR